MQETDQGFVMKKVDFAEMVEEGVALVGLVAALYQDFDRVGVAACLRPARCASDQHAELIRVWQDQAGCGANSDAMFSLFRRCRDIINPVQSALQNVVYAPPAAGVLPDRSRPDQILRAIIRVKEGWAYIDRHPQQVIGHA